jgi:hypothetical protein
MFALLFTIVWNFLLTDLSTSLLARYSTSTPFFSQSLSRQLFLSFLHAIRYVTGVEWTYDILALIFVFVGLSTPQDWPPTFGSFSGNCYTIGGLWGGFYHQWLRRNISTAGMLTNRLFSVEEGTVTSRCSRVIVGFAFSALVHTFGAVAGRYADGGLWQVVFFLSQPAGIVAEEMAMWMGRKSKIKKSGELLKVPPVSHVDTNVDS